jgi:hypothetical protein
LGRYYSPALGRFLTPDPHIRYAPHLGLRKAISIHLTAFVMNNPVNITDPKGLWWGFDDLVVAGIGFVGGAVGAIINGATRETHRRRRSMLPIGWGIEHRQRPPAG